MLSAEESVFAATILTLISIAGTGTLVQIVLLDKSQVDDNKEHEAKSY